MAVNGTVKVLHVHDDGSGSALFVGGDFNQIDGVPLRDLGRYNGTWNSMIAGVTGPLGNVNTEVRSMESHDDGSGMALYIGGSFTRAGSILVQNLTRWDGTTYTSPGSGIHGSPGYGTSVRALKSRMGIGGVAELHVGGQFQGVFSMTTSRWIAWIQGAWTDIGGPQTINSFALHSEQGNDVVYTGRETRVERYNGINRTTRALTVPSRVHSLNDELPGSPLALFAGTDKINESGSFLARWRGSTWQAIFSGPGVSMGLPNFVSELVSHALGQGKNLIALRPVSITSPAFPNPINQFDGTSWSVVPTNNFTAGQIQDAVSHDGTLYTVGLHRNSMNDEIHAVARLNGNTWENLGTPLFSSGIRAESITFFDEGSGTELFLGAHGAGDVGAPGTKGIARLVGSSWQSVGGGITQPPPGTVAVTVRKVMTWNDGTGEALYVGGAFLAAGGVATNRIAKWDGTQWSALGTGIGQTSGGGQIFDMVAYDSPTGPQLVVSGIFNLAGGQAMNSIAAWNGTSWSMLGTGIKLQGAPGFGQVLLAHDPDGLGEKIYVVGEMDEVGGLATNGGGVWDGTNWSVIGLPMGSQPTIATYDSGTGRSLFVGGGFSSAGGIGSLNIARYTDPCGAILGVPRCTATANSTGFAGITRATGSASLPAANITLTSRRLPANTFGLYFAGANLHQGFAGDGLLCVAGGLKRLNPGGLTTANGILTKVFDFNAPYASLAVPGQSLVIQGFFRDVAGGPLGFNTTDALEILMLP